MSDHTKIEWADATVNAVNGCSLESPGCTNCYAMRLAATRLKHVASRAGLAKVVNGHPVWTGEVRLDEKQLLSPLKWKRPRRIFWNAHGDTFHPSVPDGWIDRIFAVCALTPQHTHMILTKRSARMWAWFARRVRNPGYDTFAHADDFVSDQLFNLAREGRPPAWPLPNVWLGVSVEDQVRADARIPDLLATPAAVRFISAEPLLGPVDLSARDLRGDREVLPLGAKWLDRGADAAKLDWVIAGGESGPGARPMHPDWARSLRDQCAAAGVAFHFKQWGEFAPDDGEGGTEKLTRLISAPARNWAEGRWHDLPKLFSERSTGDFDVYRIGKKRAGRMLDGIEHNGLPA